MVQTSSPASGRPVLALGYIFLRIGAAAFGGLDRMGGKGAKRFGRLARACVCVMWATSPWS